MSWSPPCRAERTAGPAPARADRGEQHERHPSGTGDCAQVGGRDHGVRALTLADAPRKLGAGHHDEAHALRRWQPCSTRRRGPAAAHAPDLADGGVIRTIGAAPNAVWSGIHDAAQVRTAVLESSVRINGPRPRALLLLANVLTSPPRSRTIPRARAGDAVRAAACRAHRIARIKIEQRRALLQPLQRGTRRPRKRSRRSRRVRSLMERS